MSKENSSKRLAISYQGKEITRANLASPSVIVGRSPVCDIVVRAPGLKPVHFMMEWMGSDHFVPNEGEWSITDVSGASGMSEEQVAAQGIGQGAVFDEQPVKLGDYEFKWVTDRLSETVLEGGAISDQVRGLKVLGNDAKGAFSVLEVITINTEMDKVVQVHHIDLTQDKVDQDKLEGLPPMMLAWEPANKVTPLKVQLKGANTGLKVFQKGIAVPLDKEADKSFGVGKGDLLQLNWQLKDYYFRLVPKINAPPTPLAIFKDPFYRHLATAFLIFLLLLLITTIGDFKPEEVPPPPPRFAKIEIHKPEPLPEPTSEPAPEPVETPKEPPKAKEPKKQEVVKAPPQPTKAPAPPKGPKAPDKTPKIALNSPAPKQEVNKVGLLGAIQKNPKNTVRADMVMNDAIVSKTVGGPDAQFVVKQPPSGVLGTRTRQGRDASLSGASTTLAGGDSIAGRSTGPIVDTSGSNSIQIGGGGGLASDSDGGDEFTSVSGGLDKESVRRTLAAYRKEVRTCYERALSLKPQIRGRVVYQWTITAQGITTSSSLLRTDVGSPTLEGCVLDVIRTIRWPKAANGRPTIVKYPFEFQSKK